MIKELSTWGGDYHVDSRRDATLEKYIENLEAPNYGYRGFRHKKMYNEAIELDRADDLTQE